MLDTEPMLFYTILWGHEIDTIITSHFYKWGNWGPEKVRKYPWSHSNYVIELRWRLDYFGFPAHPLVLNHSIIPSFQNSGFGRRGMSQTLLHSFGIVTWTRLLNLSEPRFAHLHNGDSNTSLRCFQACTHKNEARWWMWIHAALSILFSSAKSLS